MALAVSAILLGPLAMLEFLRWVGVDTGRPLVVAAIFAVTALIAGNAAFAARVAYGALLAGLSALVAWLVLWGEILDHPSPNAYRWLLVVAAALLLLIAAALAARDAIGAGELATAGGIAAIGAGIIGILVGTVLGIIDTVSGGSGSSEDAPLHVSQQGHGLGSLTSSASGLQDFGWDLYLLLVSLALIWIGSRVRARGLGYVGGAGLLAFLLSVGAQLTRLESGAMPSSSVVGWPLALVTLGLAGLMAPVLLRRRES